MGNRFGTTAITHAALDEPVYISRHLVSRYWRYRETTGGFHAAVEQVQAYLPQMQYSSGPPAWAADTPAAQAGEQECYLVGEDGLDAVPVGRSRNGSLVGLTYLHRERQTIIKHEGRERDVRFHDLARGIRFSQLCMRDWRQQHSFTGDTNHCVKLMRGAIWNGHHIDRPNWVAPWRNLGGIYIQLPNTSIIYGHRHPSFPEKVLFTTFLRPEDEQRFIAPISPGGSIMIAIRAVDDADYLLDDPSLSFLHALPTGDLLEQTDSTRLY